MEEWSELEPVYIWRKRKEPPVIGSPLREQSGLSLVGQFLDCLENDLAENREDDNNPHEAAENLHMKIVILSVHVCAETYEHTAQKNTHGTFKHIVLL